MVGPIDEKSVWFLFSVVISITQFSDFWVMSYGNWKHILSVFNFHNSVSNGILVIKLTYMGPTINENVKSHTRHTFFFFFIFLSFFLLHRLIPMAIFFFFFILFFLFFFIETPNILYQKKKKRKKKERKNWRPNLGEERKKKGQKLRLTSDRETQYVVLITKMPLKTELWKLKTPKMCFQFP